MKILVDKKPQKPSDCLFSRTTFMGEYVCKFQGECKICNVNKCKFLKLVKE
jgi:hypothetical protein